jgi:hypothetical protein
MGRKNLEKFVGNLFFGNRAVYKIIARNDGRATEAKNI